MSPEHNPSPQSTSVHPLIDDEWAHTLKNHLSVILGYCELLLLESSPGDSRHGDFVDMQRAAKAALAMLEQERDR